MDWVAGIRGIRSHGRTPRRSPPASPGPHICKGVLLPSGKTGPSASGKTRGFGAACPMAHMFARLRIADPISGIVARLTTGSGGLTLGRAGFAPAGRQTKFHEVIASSFPFDPHCLVALFYLSVVRSPLPVSRSAGGDIGSSPQDLLIAPMTGRRP